MKNLTILCCSICVIFSITVRGQNLNKTHNPFQLRDKFRPSDLSQSGRHNDERVIKRPGGIKFPHRSEGKDRIIPRVQSNLLTNYDDTSGIAWVRHYASHLVSGEDAAYSIAFDQWGNVYVTGLSTGSGIDYDYVTIKYNSNGDTLWCRSYNGPGNENDEAVSLAVDASGNVYVTGYSYSYTTNYDYLTIKYNTTGDSLWCRRYDGTGNSEDYAVSLAVDASGNVYVTGQSHGSGTYSDYLTIKYNTDGDSLWCRRYNGPGNSEDFATALAVDASGNVYVTGNSYSSGTYYDYLTIKYNTDGDSLWCRRYNGPGNSNDYAVSLAVHASGNVYVTGESYTSATNTDYLTIKYNTNGDSLWCKRYNGTGNSEDYAVSLAVDALGDVYVAGWSYSTGTSSDYLTIKYNTNGDSLWCKRYNGPENSFDKATSLAIDAFGNVYVTGYSYGSGTDYDYLTIKYNTDGDSLWCRRYNGTGNSSDEAVALAVDASENVYVTGYSYGSDTYSDYLTIKYNTNGDSLWCGRYDGSGNSDDYAIALAVDASGNVYITGNSYSSTTYSDYLTIKYNTNGDSLWCRRYDGPENSEDYAASLAVDAAGNVYVTGISYSSDTYSDYLTIKYNTDGDSLWCRRYNGPGNYYDYALSLAVDASGNVYVTGQSHGSGTYFDYLTIKYNTDGDSLWCRRYNGPGNSGEYATSLAVDASGNVYVTGNSYSSGTYSDYLTIKYNTDGDSLWCRSYHGPSNYSDYAVSIVVDASGNVYVTGRSYGSDLSIDYATIKYNTDGDSLWCRRYNGPGNSEDHTVSLAVDASGNVYVTGFSYSYTTPSDYLTIKYNTDGDSLWCRRYDGPENSFDKATSLAINASGNVYVTGESHSSTTYSDYLTIKYNTNGDSIWCRRYNVSGNSDDFATALAVDVYGNVYVTGNSSLQDAYSVYTTIKYEDIMVGGIERDVAKPALFKLEQNYPNPFNPITTLKYQLPMESKVKLTVYNVLGQAVTTLVNEVQVTGNKSKEWNATNMPSGLYFYRLEATSIDEPSRTFTQVRKMILIK